MCVDKLVLYKLSGLTSQSLIMDLLQAFVESTVAEILVLVINMQEFKLQTINHIRVMIEEEESLMVRKEGKLKLFVTLLHFPPSKFSRACYPSLFLQGWDHYYLDTIAHSAMPGVINIQSWFCECCFPHDSFSAPENLLVTLKEILNEAIPIIASRVSFGEITNGSFNKRMSVSERTDILRELIFDKCVGAVLCEIFSTYWKPKVMRKYLKQAIVFTRSQDSTLNITDSINTTFKNLFFDFLVYMVSRINEDCNIDVLFLPTSSQAIKKLFLTLVETLDIPKLSELKMRSAHLQLKKATHYLPRFPFFKVVCKEIERILEESHEETNTKLNLMEDTDSVEAELSGEVQFLIELQNIVVKKLQDMIEV